jgi:hypothetical protein
VLCGGEVGPRLILSYMAGNKRLLIFRDKICTDQKYMQKVEKKHKTYFSEIFWYEMEYFL